MTDTVRRTPGRIVLGHTNYGKSDIRLVKVFRKPDRHEIKELRVDVSQEGDFAAAHVEGDNTGLMATDTMRNTVYALAKDRLTGSAEAFGVELVRHFLEAAPRARRVRISMVEYLWERIEAGGRPHEHSFVRTAGERIAEVTGDEAGSFTVEAGIDDLLVLKTTNSGWAGFLRDRFTTLPETDDRILSTVVTSRWSYGGATDLDFDGLWEGIRRRILESFTDHYSPSVQFTLHHMGKAVLESFPEIERIRFSLPNRHHLLYDLERFGMENPGEIFHADAEPYGLIEGTVERSS